MAASTKHVTSPRFAQANPHVLADEAEYGPRSDIWKISAFLEIENIVGKDRAYDLLELYVLKLEEAESYLTRRRVSAMKARELAHDIKSMSGQLGFEALQRYSSDMMATSDRKAVEGAAQVWRSLIQSSCDAARFYAMPTFGKPC